MMIQSTESRFWKFVEKTWNCWIWKGAIVRGYGVFAVRHHRPVQAHRFAYELLKGPIPQGLTLDHLCRNRACVNPDHLEAVTMAENLFRGDSWAGINVRKTHCPKGHPLEGDNLVKWALQVKGERTCKICFMEVDRRRKWEKRHPNEVYPGPIYKTQRKKRTVKN